MKQERRKTRDKKSPDEKITHDVTVMTVSQHRGGRFYFCIIKTFIVLDEN